MFNKTFGIYTANQEYSHTGHTATWALKDKGGAHTLYTFSNSNTTTTKSGQFHIIAPSSVDGDEGRTVLRTVADTTTNSNQLVLESDGSVSVATKFVAPLIETADPTADTLTLNAASFALQDSSTGYLTIDNLSSVSTLTAGGTNTISLQPADAVKTTVLGNLTTTIGAVAASNENYQVYSTS